MSINDDNLNELDDAQKIVIIFLSSLGLITYFVSLLIMIFYVKKIQFIKSKSFSFIILNSITDLLKLYLDKSEYKNFKIFIIFTSYLIQFHFVISAINKMLTGKKIFKQEKDFSIQKLLTKEIIILPLIFFPYEKYFQNIGINILQYLIIIILIVLLYNYIKKKIEELLNYLKENSKDNIEIPYMEPEELFRVYLVIRHLWNISFIFGLLYYIFKFFDVLLKDTYNVHYLITLILIIIEKSIIIIIFICLTYVVYLLNKSYQKGQIVQTDEGEISHVSHEEKEKKENENNKLEIEDNNVEKNEENSKNEDNTIEIDNKEGSDEKNNKNNEEEKLDDENEVLKISKETDKLK